MDSQLLAILNESIGLTERLARLLERDCEEITNCLNGSLATEYKKGVNQAQILVAQLRNELCTMRGM